MQTKIVKKEEILNKKEIEGYKILSYSEGFFCVKKDDEFEEYWLVSEDLNRKLGPFETETHFSSGLATLNYGKKVINTDGKKVFHVNDKDFHYIGEYVNGIAIAIIFSNKELVDKMVCINKKGNQICKKKRFDLINDFKDDVTTAFNNGKAYIIDKKGNILVELSNCCPREFSEGLCAVRLNDTKLFSFIDKNGNVVISGNFSNAQSFSEGLAAVQDDESKKWGYIDKEGNLKIPFIYNEVSNFNSGYAAVNEEAIKSYPIKLIDKNGNNVLEDYYHSIEVSDGMIIIDEKYYVSIKDLEVIYSVAKNENVESRKEFQSKEERDLYFDIYLNEINNIEETVANIRASMYLDLDKNVELTYSLKKGNKE